MKDPYDYQMVELFRKQAEAVLGTDDIKASCERLITEKLKFVPNGPEGKMKLILGKLHSSFLRAQSLRSLDTNNIFNVS